MCIIVIKESGTPVNWDMLDVCDANNPDGGGYAYNSPDGVVIRKGFFFPEEMEQALDAEPIDQTKTLIMFHFRIATHGEINEGTCHPFPMSSDVDKLTATNIVAPIAVAHNGIVPGMPRDKKLSDTMLFIRDYMAPLGRLIKKRSVQTLVEELASSKLAILTEGGVTLLGNFIHKDGHYFSNSGYKKYTTTYPSTLSYSTTSVGKGSSTKRHDDELWTAEDEMEWQMYNDPERLYNTDMMLGNIEHFCDSCGRSYVPDERKHDKLGDAVWMICEKCIEIPVEEAKV